MDSVHPSESGKRIVSIDRFRGICLIFMVLQFLMGTFEESFGNFAKVFNHGEDGLQLLPRAGGEGLAFADLFAPMFIFIIGMTLIGSFKSRAAKYGEDRAYASLAVRFLGIIGVGCLLNGVEDCWIEALTGETAFAEIDLGRKIFGICVPVVIALILLKVIASLLHNEKIGKISATVLRLFLAAVGVFGIYAMIVHSAEFLGFSADNRFGGYVWDTLQNIGVAGLIALPFVKVKKEYRLVFVGVVFIAMTVFAQNGGVVLILSKYIEGGLFASATWACILLLGSVFFELRHTKAYYVLAVGLLLWGVILACGFGFIVQKRGCTPVYAAVCASVAALLYAALELLENKTCKFAVCTWWGGSSLLVYVVNTLVCFGLGLCIANREEPVALPVVLVIIAVVLCLYTFGNYLLAKGNKHVRI